MTRESAAADLHQAIADRDLARLNLDYTVIRSPIDGFVGNRSARVGSYDRLKAEIVAKLDALQAAGQPIIPKWVSHAICKDHESGLGDDQAHSDFWRHGGYMHTRRMVTECINKRCDGTNKSTGDQRQLPLPGFDRDLLQDYYVVERDDEEVAVCVLDMTDDELEAKARHHEAVSATNAAHAREIRRFIAWRKDRHHRAPGCTSVQTSGTSAGDAVLADDARQTSPIR